MAATRKVYGRKQCHKCGGEIGFYKNGRGNWVPCELDGSDHWDKCREVRFRRAGKKLVTHRYDPNKNITYGKNRGEPYSGEEPPWD